MKKNKEDQNWNTIASDGLFKELKIRNCPTSLSEQHPYLKTLLGNIFTWAIFSSFLDLQLLFWYLHTLSLRLI